ncbi:MULTISPECIES: hypothetical protein [unclassified Lentimonas]|uniref:hypothetical protein n=1 Tax=unclassified Lentimonas TaxID=2630993 RepID=UPI00132A8455|nr:MULTISPECIES: hypothetical protein [unclassified Lentimonas]CAA6694996.1 Unannotated [Lentimonas sp. CC19]CAA6695365.1 Unannotated [Lentimonas sp. CC10]CAA7072027.1 Unannotated [Lentimonas sp. CC11]
MNTLETKYGVLHGVTDIQKGKSGHVESCMLNRENRIQTPVGELIPQFRPDEFGERQKKYRSSLSFFDSGEIKSAALDLPLPIQTPLDEYKAELVTFYKSGGVNRLFPLNGKIDGYWSEKNEGELAERLEFELPLGRFMSKVIGIHFYESGALKSLTLWPGEKIVLKTPVGLMRVRTGFSLYEDGSLKTVEPAQPMRIDTSIGSVLAFDAEMVGMHADQNSVQFAPNGELLSLKTVHTGVRVQASDAAEVVMEPLETTSLIDMEEMRTVPMQIDFSADTVRIVGVTEQVFDRSGCTFSTFERSQVLRSACASCAGCSGAEASCCTS